MGTRKGEIKEKGLMAWDRNYEPKKREGRRSRGFRSHFEKGTRGLCALLGSVSKNGGVAYTFKASCIDLYIRTKTQNKDRQGLTSTLFARPERVPSLRINLPRSSVMLLCSGGLSSLERRESSIPPWNRRPGSKPGAKLKASQSAFEWNVRVLRALMHLRECRKHNKGRVSHC